MPPAAERPALALGRGEKYRVRAAIRLRVTPVNLQVGWAPLAVASGRVLGGLRGAGGSISSPGGP